MKAIFMTGNCRARVRDDAASSPLDACVAEIGQPLAAGRR